MKQLPIIMSLFVLCSVARAQVNVQLLHQLVAENKSEHDRQQDAKNKQTVATANEAVNRSQMEKLKNKYRELQERFHTVGLAIDAAQIALEASPIVSEIIHWQQVIFQQAQDNPLLIPIAIQTEIDLAGRARMLANYIIGIAVSIGDINQMRASDRKILFSHALAQLRQIEGTSRGLAWSMVQAGRKVSGNPFAGFVNRDRQMVEDIMRNIEILKK